MTDFQGCNSDTCIFNPAHGKYYEHYLDTNRVVTNVLKSDRHESCIQIHMKGMLGGFHICISHAMQHFSEHAAQLALDFLNETLDVPRPVWGVL